MDIWKELQDEGVDAGLLEEIRRFRAAHPLTEEAAALGKNKEVIQEAIEACGLPPTIRGEALTLEDLARLSEVLSDNKI